MNERIKKLRAQSVETQPYISTERAELITEFYRNNYPGTESPAVFRAKAFRYLMENKSISINDGELIAGQRGTGPKATPTYPELCCHSIEDLKILDSRERTPFAVGEKDFQVYEEKIIPFWKGKTIREKVFDSMEPDWKKAFEAGVFTEFMEQRAPGHAILDDKIYRESMTDFKNRCSTNIEQLDYFADKSTENKKQQYEAMIIAADAIITFAKRYAKLAEEMAKQETNPERKRELKKISEICNYVPENTPRTFHEALQMYWFVHLAVITELNTWDSFNPGRIDQHLYPFYRKEMQEGTLTRERAKELLECFWIKFNNEPAPPKVGITEQQSGTYTDFALVNIGGIKPSNGSDAVNELSFLILDVANEMRLTQPSLCVQISKKNPERFLKKACRVIRTGFGQPSVFNTDVIIQQLLHAGKTVTDARNGGPSGCVTISAFGKESCTLTGYLNWAKIFELTCFNGTDPRTGEQVGLKTGEPSEFTSFEQFFDAFKKQLKYFIDIKIQGNNVIERIYADFMPTPVMSLLMDDCIEKGIDYHNGGARYNPTYIQGVGMGTLTDALASVEYNVFKLKRLSISRILEAVRANFEGYEDLRDTLRNASPKYGNDDERADRITEKIFETYYSLLNGRANTKGGRYRVNLLPTTAHIYFGAVTGALPDGRKSGVPVSEGVSPSQGADVKGPTAVIKSVSRIDHARTGGTLLNMKFNPQLLEDEEGIEKLAKLIRTYFTLDGHHIQFNVIDADTLRSAQEKPEEYSNLIVRVAGYSDYFHYLGKDLQNEIISRTEQTGF